MPSPTCFTECTEQPCFLFFMFFPVIPSGAASIIGKKSCWASQKQNAHRSRTFHFWKAQQGFTLFVHLSLENLVLHSLLASVMPLWTLGYNITICSWRPAGFHQSIFGVQCVAKTVEDNVTAFKTFRIYYFVLHLLSWVWREYGRCEHRPLFPVKSATLGFTLHPDKGY